MRPLQNRCYRGYISIAWKDAIAFVALILILIVRPTGLLGERVADKI